VLAACGTVPAGAIIAFLVGDAYAVGGSAGVGGLLSETTIGINNVI